MSIEHVVPSAKIDPHERRFRQERSKESLIIRKEPLRYQELGHLAAAMNSELSLLVVHFMGDGTEWTTQKLREHITRLSPEPDIDSSEVKGQIDKLIVFNLARIAQKEGPFSRQTYALEKERKQVVSTFAGYNLAISAKYPQSIREIWGDSQPRSAEEIILPTPEGDLHYRTRDAEIRLRLFDQLVQADIKDQLPLRSRDLDLPLKDRHSVHDKLVHLAESGILTYIFSTPKKPFTRYKRVSLNEQPIEPLEYRKDRRSFDYMVEKYIFCSGDELPSPEGAAVYMENRFPEMRLYDHAGLRKQAAIALAHIARQRFLEAELDSKHHSHIALMSHQSRMLRELVRTMRDVQDRNPEGRKLGERVLSDPDRRAVIFDKM